MSALIPRTLRAWNFAYNGTAESDELNVARLQALDVLTLLSRIDFHTLDLPSLNVAVLLSLLDAPIYVCGLSVPGSPFDYIMLAIGRCSTLDGVVVLFRHGEDVGERRTRLGSSRSLKCSATVYFYRCRWSDGRLRLS